MKIEDAKLILEELEKAREELINLARNLKINSTKVIASIHSGCDYRKYLNGAFEVFKEIMKYREYDQIFHSITHEALQEFVEAYFLVKIIEGSFNFEMEFEIPPSPFITGLADLIGELRRLALSKLMKNDFEEAVKFLDLMERVYNELLPFTAFPDKLVPNLRVKLDLARSLIDRTKSDYVAAKLHESLDRDR